MLLARCCSVLFTVRDKRKDSCVLELIVSATPLVDVFALTALLLRWLPVAPLAAASLAGCWMAACFRLSFVVFGLHRCLVRATVLQLHFLERSEPAIFARAPSSSRHAGGRARECVRHCERFEGTQKDTIAIF